MGDVALEGFGSGGASLNYKIVGGITAPDNPKENTIWVKTDVNIGGHLFSAKNPNLLDFDKWANNIDVFGGTKAVSGNTISITADENGDAYTKYDGDTDSVIPCTPKRTYVIEWNHAGDEGGVYVFANADTNRKEYVLASVGKLEYTVPDGVTFFTFRVGSRTANGTSVFSDIRITRKDQTVSLGGIWILTGTESDVEFNTLKKNGIQVYPISAKQYISGVWTDKPTMIYQSGEWVVWRTYLYKDGQFATEQTGALEKVLETYGTPILTYNEKDINLVDNNGNCVYMFENLLDLSGKNKLCVECRLTGVGNYNCNIVVASKKNSVTVNGEGALTRAAIVKDNTIHVEEIDISGIDSGYIGFTAEIGSTSDEYNLTFYKFWLV